jgi:peptidyl-prolyl cis-trans isomerase A (cyclophilin A)
VRARHIGWLVLLGVGGCDEPASDNVASAAPSASAAPKPAPSAGVPTGPPLMTPAAAAEQAPAKYRVAFDTTKGKAVIEVVREWAPRAADRFYNLVKIGYYDDVPFYRVTLEVAQFGIHGDPKVTAAWRDATMLDEMVKQPNHKGMVTFARRGGDSRTTQIFINLKDNSADFDEQGFSPFGKVVEGFDEVIAKLNNEYGERPQQGDAPKRMVAEGAPFIAKEFPKLDYIKDASIL